MKDANTRPVALPTEFKELLLRITDSFGGGNWGQRTLMKLTEVAQSSLGVGNYDDSLNRTGERRLLTALNATLGPLTVIDIGAHHGWWSSALLEASPGNRVVAIEPDPQAFSVLSANLVDAPGALLLNVGVADEDAVQLLHIDPSNSQLSTLLSDIVERTPETLVLAGNSSIEVSVVRFASLLNQVMEAGFISHVDEINLIKIDTEGFEFSIVEQVTALPDLAVPVLQFEFNSHALAQGQLIDDFAKLLGSRYQLFRLAPRRLIPRSDLSFTAANAAGFSNWVAINPSLAPQIQEHYRRS